MKDHILIADDDPDVISALQYLLETEGYAVSTARTPDEALSLLNKVSINLLLMDLNYSKDTTSGKEGLELVQKIGALNEQPPIVVMTAWGSVETAVKAMQEGARDFIQKPWENDRLLSIIANQILLQKTERQSQKLEEENQLLRNQIEPSDNALVSDSPSMQALLTQLRQVAESDVNILLTGENGTGKSYLAKHVHAMSQRSKHTLISVNMGSISESLFESEMFGHVKGAFTDARENRIGRFELADKGTLFLDEVGNTPYSQQAKLLRVLENREFERVGSSKTQQSDCRLICATNCDLDAAVESEYFRKDLLYRINTFTIEVPALRHRREDILQLAESFLQNLKKKYNKPGLLLSVEANLALEEYHWPGNIRELDHVIERAAILTEEDEIRVPGLGLSRSPDGLSATAAAINGARATLDEIEKSVLVARLRLYDGNSLDTAQSLGLSKSAFYRHLKKHQL